MKTSTVNQLRQCVDVEQIGDGALREDIELAERHCERMGNQEVPWTILVSVLVKHGYENTGATMIAGVDAVTQREADGDTGVGGNVSVSADKSDRLQAAILRDQRRQAKQAAAQQ